MLIPPPNERPDLYDDYDGQSYSPTSAQYLIAVTPDPVKRTIEQMHGKPFSEIAEEMEADSWRTALIYYVVDGAVFRKLPGRPLDLFDQTTGRFDSYKGDASLIKLGMPMDIAQARLHMQVEPDPDKPG